MNRTGIEYLDCTWNPVVGCSGAGCAVRDHCWARKQARRQSQRCRHCADFFPHVHLERLEDPLHVKKPSLVGCCFMGDLFDPLIANANRRLVFRAMESAPWHTFLLLTKQPQNVDRSERYPGNLILGVSVNTQEDLWRVPCLKANYPGRKAVSFEPLLEPMGNVAPLLSGIEWVIIGAQTRPSVQPKAEWVRILADQARKAGVAELTFKDNLEEAPVR